MTPKITSAIPTIIGIMVSKIPSQKQFFASFLSSSFSIKYAIMPPIICKNIGTRYHHLLFLFVGPPDISEVCADNCLPHLGQKLTSGATSAPQEEQNGIIL